MRKRSPIISRNYFDMSTRQIQKLLTDAIDAFLHFDKELLINDAHEQAIAHKIASYIEKDNARGYSVDCEYNKRAEDAKRWHGKIFRPDIIVHKRGRNGRGDNLLVVEIKKDKICKSNIARLKFMTNPYNNAFGYELGCFLYFKNGIPQYTWIGGGKVQAEI